MAKCISLILVLMILISCGQNEKSVNEADAGTVSDSLDQVKYDTLCFIKTGGKSNRDTATVKLIIGGQMAEGEMSDRIWEKDARKGKLQGAVNDNILHMVYVFMQEGVEDSMKLDFKLSDSALFQKPIIYNKTDGKPMQDTSADYTVKYFKTECVPEEKFMFSGNVLSIERGKDGYNALVREHGGDTLMAVISRVQLREEYVSVKEGDKISFSGDTTRLENRMLVRVRSIKQ
jgi:hypothetical protein